MKIPLMVRILANDGIDAAGKQKLTDHGFEVVTDKIEQEDLKGRLNDFDAILVRSATKVRQDLIDASPNLKFIGRGGVGMDNIDVEYARGKGMRVQNTPAASSQSVAELVFAHLFTGVRFLHDANRHMPQSGHTDFAKLKKSYAKGVELQGAKLGIIGFGMIGQAVARMGIGLGMEIIPHDLEHKPVELELQLMATESMTVNVKLHTESMDKLLAESDFISLHVPFKAGQTPIIGAAEFTRMKDGAGLVNAARGGAVDEDALLAALDSGKLRFAGLDVFENEPTPRQDLLQHPKTSVTPHIGASTGEAQERVWMEMAAHLIDFFDNKN